VYRVVRVRMSQEGTEAERPGTSTTVARSCKKAERWPAEQGPSVPLSPSTFGGDVRSNPRIPPPSETGLWLPSKNTLRVDQAIAVLLEEISCVIDNTQGLTRESFVHAKRFYLVCWQGIMHRRRFDSPSVSRLGMLLCV
jgi:hypothetical protein